MTASLHILLDSFKANRNGGYFQGMEAYDKWVAGLRNDTLWDSGNSKEDIERRLGVNDSTLLNLIDARRCASEYLSECVHLLTGKKADLLNEIISVYRKIVQQLSTFRIKLKAADG